jgi:inner membrane protein
VEFTGIARSCSTVRCMRFSMLSKLASLTGVMLILLWALSRVSDVVAEREGRLREAQRSIADSMANAQTLTGPLLQRQCTDRWKEQEGQGKERKWTEQRSDFTLTALPQRLVVDATARIEPRTRGIFRINGYSMTSKLQADWSDLAALQPPPLRSGAQRTCADPVLWVGVTDPRGIRSASLTIAGTRPTVRPGTPSATVPRGFQATWTAGAAHDAKAPVSASVELELAGTEDVSFAPIGEASRVKLASDWPHPSFNGRFLPTQRTITDQGFEAEWQFSALASRSGQDLLMGNSLCAGAERTAAEQQPQRCIERFGVAFIDPVSTYVLSDRATKYGLLFIVLTFAAIGLLEVMRRLRVHPVQYALVGSALAIFFLLLVSLSEHIDFALAYAVASTACTLLLGYYAVHVLHSGRLGAGFAGGIGVLYGFLFLLLHSEQSALVLGSMLLFMVLAGVMVVTRRIDWYAVTSNLRSDGPSGTKRATA